MVSDGRRTIALSQKEIAPSRSPVTPFAWAIHKHNGAAAPDGGLNPGTGRRRRREGASGSPGEGTCFG